MTSMVPFLRQEIIAPTSQENPRNGEGDIVALADGRLLLAWGRFTGPYDYSPADIHGRFSEDGGYTWGSPFLIQENVGTCNVMSASFLSLQSGDLLFAFLVKNHQRTDCRCYVRRSTDQGRTWSPPLLTTPEQGYFVVNNDRLVQLASGRILVPAAKSFGDIHHGMAGCFCSDDDGRTWRRCCEYIDLADPVGLQEPGIVERADGDLWMYLRTAKRRIYESSSSDGGETWSPPQPTSLVAPRAPASAKRLPGSDDILMIYNDRSALRDTPDDTLFAWRTPLASAVSSDGGRTWGQLKLVEDDQSKSYCYTSIDFVGDATLLTYYVGVAGGPNLVDLKLTIVPTAAWTD